jgi:hypothetical protein
MAAQNVQFIRIEKCGYPIKLKLLTGRGFGGDPIRARVTV